MQRTSKRLEDTINKNGDDLREESKKKCNDELKRELTQNLTWHLNLIAFT